MFLLAPNTLLQSFAFPIKLQYILENLRLLKTNVFFPVPLTYDNLRRADMEMHNSFDKRHGIHRNTT